MSDLIRREDAIHILACEMYAEAQSEGYDAESVEDYIPEATAWMSDAPSAEPPYQYSKAYVEQIRGERDILQDMVNNVAEPKTGEWIDRDYRQVDEDGYETAICSNCKAEITLEYPYDNYCPNCGAKMEGGDTE